MSSENRDLTIETALADPMIRAVMRADHITPGDFETLLRGAARKMEARAPRVPTLLLAHKSCMGFPKACFA